MGQIFRDSKTFLEVFYAFGKTQIIVQDNEMWVILATRRSCEIIEPCFLKRLA